jgi:hypothetical protein
MAAGRPGRIRQAPDGLRGADDDRLLIIDVTGPIGAVGEPDQVDIVLPVAKETLRKSAPPVAAMVDPCPWLVAVTGLPRHRTSASSSALPTRRRPDAPPGGRLPRWILLGASQPARVSLPPTGSGAPE